MTYTSEIEKLEKRWAENPKGRNFAPLADAYRKAGELDRAIELCKSGLERHPDYVSAHIVYGRCFLDLKNDTQASQVFRRVLELDPENVLGLKLLAEIAERGGRYDEAGEWLSRLLAADPMNGDAAEALARTKGKAAQAAPKPAAPPPPPPPPPPTPQPAAAPSPAPSARPEFVVEHASEQPMAPQPGAPHPTGDLETFDGTLDFNAVAHDAARADGLEVQEEVELEPQDLIVEGLAASQYESGTFARPAPAGATNAGPEAEPDLPSVDLPLIMPEEMEPPRPAAAAGLGPPSPLTPPPPPSPRPPVPPPAAVGLSDDDGAADTAALSRAEPVLTETMAELYLKQGHQEDALRVYEALLAQRPGDARLHARVDALSPRPRLAGRATGESVPAFLKRILAGRLQVAMLPEPEASGEAASPLDRAFAMAPPEPEPEAAGAGTGGSGREHEGAGPGEATHPAEDTISLDQVFGDEGSKRAAPPAQPPTSSAPVAPPGTQTGGFSFDQFFGGGAVGGGGAGAAPGAAGGMKPAARASGPRSRPIEDEGDLDQFQAWLKGLKS